MCLFLFSGEPVPSDVRKDRENTFAVGMMEAPAEDPLCMCLPLCVLYLIKFMCLCTLTDRLFVI